MNLDAMMTYMLAATRAIEDFKRTHGEPQKEIRLHPEDYDELRRVAKPFANQPSLGTPSSFSGLRIVVDESAERLPRKGKA